MAWILKVYIKTTAIYAHLWGLHTCQKWTLSHLGITRGQLWGIALQ